MHVQPFPPRIRFLRCLNPRCLGQVTMGTLVARCERNSAWVREWETERQQLTVRSCTLEAQCSFLCLFCCHCIFVDGTNSAGARKPRPTAQERIAFLEREAREQLERREARDARSARLSPSRVHSVRLQDDSPRLTAEEDRRASRSPGRMARSYRDIDGQDDSWAHSRTSSFEGSPSAVFGTASRFPSPPRLMVTD